MQSDSYQVPHVSRPRVASRRWIFLLMFFLALALASYWIPMFQDFPAGPSLSLADDIRIFISLLIEEKDMRAIEAIRDTTPVLFVMLAHGIAISLAILLAGLALRVRRPSVLILLIVITTLIAGLSGWVISGLDQLFPPGMVVPAPSLPGVYVGLGASLAAWITALVAYRQRRSGAAPH
jgi:hypothetical protein